MAGNRPRGALRMSLPLMAVIAAGLVWCGYWYFASAEIRQRIAERESMGIPLVCGEEEWAGFPFRFTLICKDAELRLETPDGPVSLATGRLSLTALAYRPNHVIAEASSPADIALPGLRIKSEEAPLRAGLKFELASGEPRELSLSTSDWSGRFELPVAGAGNRTVNASADAFLLHWRPADNGNAQSLGLQTQELVLRNSAPLPGEPDEVTLDSLAGLVDITAFDITRPPDTLKDWQAAGGRIEIRHLAGKAYGQDVVAQGGLGLDASGLADGRVEADILDLDGLLKTFIANGTVKENEAVMISTAVRLLSGGAKDLEEGRSRVPVIFSKGRFYVGPFKVTTLPSLFR